MKHLVEHHGVEACLRERHIVGTSLVEGNFSIGGVVRELQQEFGMSIIFITHDMGVISQIADDVAIMYLGRIAERGRTEDVVFDPQHPYSQGLIDTIPKLDNIDERLSANPGDIPSPLNRPSGCPFHTRCERLIPGKCDSEFPAYVTVKDEHLVGCHLFTDGPQS